MVLEEDRPTPIDVAIAATRDLHMQQAKGYGAFALRSVMLIRYSQKVSYLQNIERDILKGIRRKMLVHY